MTTGMLGNVMFEVTDKSVRTITSMARSRKASYSTHSLIGKTGIIEFDGIDPEEISIEVVFSAYLGENPETWRKKLEDLQIKGKALTFVLGTWPVGNTKWVIESLSFSSDKFWKDGTPAEYAASIGLKEYAN